MAWPPTSNGANVIIKGSVTTIVWGTSAFAPGFGTQAIVKSIKITERNSEFPIEQGAGLTAQEVLLLDGLNAEITVEDDSNITWPIGGANFTLVCPQIGFNGASNTANIAYLMINNDYNGARKTAGERVILGKAFALFAS
jgi:hypothetical protein